MSAAFTLDRTADVVDVLMRMNAKVLPGMMRRDHAAWIMNVLAHEVGPWLCRADEAGRALAAAQGKQIHIAARIAPKGYLECAVDGPGLPAGRTSAPAAAIAIARLFGPTVHALAYAGPLAPKALWRIAADGMAWGWTQAGQTERAEAVLTTYGAPYANSQLACSNGVLVRRGGCCRYLSVSGAPCTACPLRKKS
ncbi:hypothetical protein ACEWPL_016660 [Roseovarius sp. S1116L3]|uniref:hypothetical protein n=1 Tax=Roseovarius roseus TaxID=3342636 RepID=UPI003728ECFE